MPIEPVKIPQNVYIEDRIVGPLTLRQIIIVCIGCGFSYGLWAMLNKAYGGIALPLTVMVWMPGALSVLFAFVRINDLSLLHICLLFVERLSRPSTRVWAPRRGVVINIRTYAVPQQQAVQPAAVGKRPERLEELSTVLDGSAASERQPDLEVHDVQPNNDRSQMSEDTRSDVTPTRLAVNPQRVRVTPLSSASLDDIHSTKDTVVFKDIFPTQSHG